MSQFRTFVLHPDDTLLHQTQQLLMLGVAAADVKPRLALPVSCAAASVSTLSCNLCINESSRFTTVILNTVFVHAHCHTYPSGAQSPPWGSRPCPLASPPRCHRCSHKDAVQYLRVLTAMLCVATELTRLLDSVLSSPDPRKSCK